MELYRKKLNRGGYDRRGRYYGVGEKLWCFEGKYSEKCVRAPSKKAALQQVKVQRLGSPPDVHAKRRQAQGENLRDFMKKARSALSKGNCSGAYSYAFLAARASGRLEAEREGSGRARKGTHQNTFRMMNKLANRIEARCMKR